MSMLNCLAPTINYGPEQIDRIPIIYGEKTRVDALVRENISLSRADWDAFETSWDFVKHPLL